MKNIEIVLGVKVTRTDFIQKLVRDHVRARFVCVESVEKTRVGNCRAAEK